MALGPSTLQNRGRQKIVLRRPGVVFMQCPVRRLNLKQMIKTFNKGSLGSRIDEERSEARNVV